MFDYNKVINLFTGKPYDLYNADRFCIMYRNLLRDNFDMRDEKMGGEKTIVNDPEMTHLRHSIGVVLRHIEQVHPPENLIDAVYKEINNIKILYENQPEYDVIIKYDSWDFENKIYVPVCREYIVKTYYQPNIKDSKWYTPEFTNKCFLDRGKKEEIFKVTKK
jgi:hypothetical protein